MSRKCEICGKGPQVGYTISHAHNKSKKVWLPNIHKRMKVCTECIRSGAVLNLS